jgi:hypothetical protein
MNTLLAMALRRAQPGTGSQLGKMSKQPRHRFGFVRLWGTDVNYAVVGARAAALYMPPRHTQDLDVLLDAEALPRVQAALTTAGAIRLGPLAIGGETWRLAKGTELDIIVLDRPWVAAALAHAVTRLGERYLALPYLALMKLEAGRTQDLADVARMLGYAAEADLAAVRAVVQRHRPGDLEDLEALIVLGRLECQTPGGSAPADGAM